MVREPPPWRNDAALLSKIASQEKLRAELPSPSPSPPPVPASSSCSGTPSPQRATAWFLLQESIRWLQESKGFYVKILQKIMARYTFLQRGNSASFASRRASFLSFSFSLHRPPFFVLTSRFFLLIFFARLPSSPSTELLCTESASPLIASPSRSASIGGRKLVEKKFILVKDSRTRTGRKVFSKQVDCGKVISGNRFAIA